MKIKPIRLCINDLYSLPRCVAEVIIYELYSYNKHRVSEALGGRYISKMKKEELIEFIVINGLI